MIIPKDFSPHGDKYDWDEAAVFGIASGIRDYWKANKPEDISEAYNGADEFSRRCLRAGIALDLWADKHVNWDEFGECWPYYAEDNIGKAMDELVECEDGLIPADLEHKHLLALAAHLQLPIKLSTPGAWINLERLRGAPSSPTQGAIQVRSVFTNAAETDVQWWTCDHALRCVPNKTIKFALYRQNKENLWDFLFEFDTYEELQQTVRFLAGSDPWNLPVDPTVQYPLSQSVLESLKPVKAHEDL